MYTKYKHISKILKGLFLVLFVSIGLFAFSLLNQHYSVSAKGVAYGGDIIKLDGNNRQLIVRNNINTQIDYLSGTEMWNSSTSNSFVNFVFASYTAPIDEFFSIDGYSYDGYDTNLILSASYESQGKMLHNFRADIYDGVDNYYFTIKLKQGTSNYEEIEVTINYLTDGYFESGSRKHYLPIGSKVTDYISLKDFAIYKNQLRPVLPYFTNTNLTVSSNNKVFNLEYFDRDIKVRLYFGQASWWVVGNTKKNNAAVYADITLNFNDTFNSRYKTYKKVYSKLSGWKTANAGYKDVFGVTYEDLEYKSNLSNTYKTEINDKKFNSFADLDLYAHRQVLSNALNGETIELNAVKSFHLPNDDANYEDYTEAKNVFDDLLDKLKDNIVSLPNNVGKNIGSFFGGIGAGLGLDTVAKKIGASITTILIIGAAVFIFIVILKNRGKK